MDRTKITLIRPLILLSEKDTRRYVKKNNKKVRSIGKIVLIIGIVILILGIVAIIFGFTGFGNTFVNGIESADVVDGDDTQMFKGVFGSFGFIALGVFMSFIGSTMTIIGLSLIITSHRREISAYTTQQSMPIMQEGIEKITPTVADAAGTIAKSINNGINDSNKDNSNE